MKNLSGKRAKACAIPRKVKRIVAERDSLDGWPCCVVCKSPDARPEAHYVSRANGGMGIPENVVTLCRPCHDKFDNGTAEERRDLGERIAEHLQACYPDWDEEKLVYKKYEGLAF